MEKILKIIKKITIYIPFLVFFISIKSVSADTIDIYQRIYSSTLAPPIYDFTHILNDTYTLTDSSIIYNDDFNFNIYSTLSTTNFLNTFVLYDLENKVYIVNNISYNGTISENKSLNIKCSGKNFTGMQKRNVEDTDWVSVSSGNWAYIISDKLIDNDIQYSILHLRDLDITTRNNYLLYNYGAHYQNNNVSKYFCSTDFSDRFIVVSAGSGDLYVKGVKQDIKQVPIEEEESPIHFPYIFDNNKYYVPNYHEGQCIEIIDKDTIRVFEDESTDFYVDYFINSNYISRQGQVSLDYIKNCSTLDFTDIRYYGNDLPQVIIITLTIIAFTIGIPYILLKRFRRR